MRDSSEGLTFERLEAHRARLSALVRSLPPGTARRSPGPDAWSLAQLLDHLLRIDRGLRLDGPRLCSVARATSGLRGAAIRSVLALPLRIPAPPGAQAVMPGADPNPQETLRKWDALRRQWAPRLTKARSGTAAFRHPIVGTLTLPDALAFLLAHHRHHDAQVRRTLAALEQLPTQEREAHQIAG